MKESKKTIIIGATPDASRYAYRAAHMLTTHGHPIVPLSIKRGTVAGETIQDLRGKPAIDGVDTITLYIGPQNQPEWQEYILSLQPKRIIFNPGTENPAFIQAAREQGIEPVTGCTLVMLQVGTY